MVIRLTPYIERELACVDLTVPCEAYEAAPKGKLDLCMQPFSESSCRCCHGSDSCPVIFWLNLETFREDTGTMEL